MRDAVAIDPIVPSTSIMMMSDAYTLISVDYAIVIDLLTRAAVPALDCVTFLKIPMTGMLYVEVRTSSRVKQYSIKIAIEYPITKYKPTEMTVAFGTTLEAPFTSSAAANYQPFDSNVLSLTAYQGAPQRQNH